MADRRVLGWHAKASPPVKASVLLLFLFVSFFVQAADNPSRPPVGRSTFDALFSKVEGGQSVYQIPFPFEKLVQTLDGLVDKGSKSFLGVKAVFFPMGRSLQRKAGYPEVFRYPRVVATPDGESSGTIDSRDRLFVGYNEKARILEVISYNELAGRFEFQVVHNYDTHGKPKVLYANRKTCLACHQNESPLFSEALWDETQANGLIAKKLQNALGSSYQGISTARNPSLPFDFNASTDRANMFSVSQRAWRELCSFIECRRSALVLMLQMRLRNSAVIDLDSRFDYEKMWQKAWPEDLIIPNSVVPNRDPLASKKSLKEIVEVESEAEPLNLREPLATWSFDEEKVKVLFSSLAQFFSASQVKQLKAVALARTKNQNDVEGQISQWVASLPPEVLEAPFRPSVITRALLRALGQPLAELRSQYPELEIDQTPPKLKTVVVTNAAKLFRRCASCHDNQTGFPPNFMSPEAGDVEKNIKHCADRIWFRLSMWHIDEHRRKKSPMPPETALEMNKNDWKESHELQLMKAFAEKIVRRSGRNPEKILKSDFSSLRACQ